MNEPDATTDISLELTSGQDFGTEIIARAHLRQLTRGHEPEFDPISGHGDPGAPAEFEIIEWELLTANGQLPNGQPEPLFDFNVNDEQILRALLGSEFPELERKAHQLTSGDWLPSAPEPELIRQARRLNAELSIYRGHKQARTSDRWERIRHHAKELVSTIINELCT